MYDALQILSEINLATTSKNLSLSDCTLFCTQNRPFLRLLGLFVAAAFEKVNAALEQRLQS